MSEFSIEDIYQCTRKEYTELTGITPQGLIQHLEAEIAILGRSIDLYRKEYREGGTIASDSQRRLSELITNIQNKIDSKILKVIDIKNEFGL